MSTSPCRSVVGIQRALAAIGCMLALGIPGMAAPAMQSSPIAINAAGTRLVNVNSEANTVSVFDITVNPPIKLAEIGVGGSDPVSVAIAGNKAYVANAASGNLAIVDLASQTLVGNISVGTEPMGVMAAPNGTRVYVANSASNNVMVVDTSTNKVVATIDVSGFGTAPRALAMTNNGNKFDNDEAIYVGLFFGQLRAGKSAVDEGQDDQREGRVLAISSASNALPGFNPSIALAPMASTGFNANGKLAPAPGQVPAVASVNPQAFTTPTGAYPNQLAAIAVHPTNGKAYVPSTAASPNGPFRFNGMAQGIVSVFDTSFRTEFTAAQTDAAVRRTAPLNMNQGINLGTTPAPRLFLTNPVAMAWRPDGSDAWVVIQNSDLVVRLTVDANGVPTVSNPLVAGPSQLVRVDLTTPPVGLSAGTTPRGIVINSAGNRAFVSNFTSRSITVIDITNGTAPVIAATVQSTALPAAGTIDDIALQGAKLFFTGRGPQGRMSSESWGGCVVCHPQGRSDNVTWMFDAGPRQTIPLDGTFSRLNPNDQRILNWSAVRDEVHDFELNTRNVFGGRGLIDDDRLFYAIGGTSGAAPTDSGLIEQYQQATGALTATNDLTGGTPLPTINAFGARRDFGMATLGDGRMFIVGGRSGAGQGALIPGASAVLEFNPRKKGLVARSSTGFTPRHSLGVLAVQTSQGARIYAIGGYSSTSAAANPVSTVEEYNPATDTWRTVASLPTAVAQFGCTVAGSVNTAEPLQLLHVVSGNTGSEGTPSVANPNPVQRFQPDPAGPGTWSAFQIGITLRRNHGVATALRGVQSRIFVIGGQDVGGTVLSSVEEYQAQAIVVVNSTHTALPKPLARFGIGSSLSTNQIYVVGGVDDTGTDQTGVLEYTINANGPTPGITGAPSGTWVTKANLSAARRSLQINTPPGVTNFLTVRSSGRDPRQDSISTWTALKVRSARAPVPATDVDAVAGRTLFGQVGLVQANFSCATCHGGPKWTRSSVDYKAPPSPEVGLGLGNQRVIGAELRQTTAQGPNGGQFPGVLINVGTFTLGGGRVNEVRFNGADISQAIAPLGANGFNIPSLLSVHETAPYYYNGLAQTLSQVLDGSQDGNGGVRHHFVANAANRASLIQFLRSIDQTTPIFP